MGEERGFNFSAGQAPVGPAGDGRRPVSRPSGGALPLVFSAEQIRAAVFQMAARIGEDYWGSRPLALGVLKGAFIFMADLVRQLPIPVDIEFVRVASYGRRLGSSGKVRLLWEPVMSLKDRHVLIVEDIVDEGHTARFLRQYCEWKGAVSVRLCALLVRREENRPAADVDYFGFLVPAGFLVGYGLDARERYRSLPDVRALDLVRKEGAP